MSFEHIQPFTQLLLENELNLGRIYVSGQRSIYIESAEKESLVDPKRKIRTVLNSD